MLVFFDLDMGVIYRDIKPQNLATKDYKNLFGVPLDLGTVIESEAEYTFVGSRARMAPEVPAKNIRFYATTATSRGSRKTLLEDEDSMKENETI